MKLAPIFENPHRACCDAETFWGGFMAQWRVRFGQEADTPDFVCRPAWQNWRKGMTGFEAAETIYRRVLACEL